MIRTMIVAAIAAASFALAVPGKAEAHMANPGLSSVVPSAVQEAQYYHRRYYGHRPYRSYGYYPRRHRHCWNERVRVRVSGGYFVWRTHRRCGWRRW